MAININEENVKSILELIEDLVLNSPKIPIFNKLMVDEDQLFTLLDNLRQNLPKEISEAKAIVQDKERIIEEATLKTKQMLEDAELKSKTLISESEVLKKARQEAEGHRQEVNHEIQRSQNDADRYVDDVLAKLENDIIKHLSIIRNGRDTLSRI